MHPPCHTLPGVHLERLTATCPHFCAGPTELSLLRMSPSDASYSTAAATYASVTPVTPAYKATRSLRGFLLKINYPCSLLQADQQLEPIRAGGPLAGPSNMVSIQQ